MALELNTLRGFLEQNDVTVRYIKNNILYCASDSRHSSLKIIIHNHKDEPYEVLKEGLSGNVWGEDFETKEDLVEFLLAKQQESL